ncbi:MAG: PstS family phosphate ABC transporter substrate-binding protein [Chloroflexales bacterium]|nr:PstS family phosphate ABC transporter substrate-binding protein [Chloroflexales bacterium]
MPLATPTLVLVTPASSTELVTLRGSISIDGSSTVFPITEATAHAFRSLAPGVEINLGVSGTGGGFRRFCAGEILIADASRPITTPEAADCAAAGIAFVELPIAYDGIAVVVNARNDWATCLTVDELRRVWEPAGEGRITTWHDVRPTWAALPLKLYGPGADSGTYDYFSAAIVGEGGRMRADYLGSEDDYLIAQDLADDPQGLGFFGYAYSVVYAGQLRTLAIDSGAGCVTPSAETITSGAYRPLARPIFIYVRADALDRAEVAAFVRFYLANATALVPSVHSIPLPARAYRLAAERAEGQITGSVFQGEIAIGISVEQLLALEANP